MRSKVVQILLETGFLIEKIDETVQWDKRKTVNRLYFQVMLSLTEWTGSTRSPWAPSAFCTSKSVVDSLLEATRPAARSGIPSHQVDKPEYGLFLSSQSYTKGSSATSQPRQRKITEASVQKTKAIQEEINDCRYGLTCIILLSRRFFLNFYLFIFFSEVLEHDLSFTGIWLLIFKFSILSLPNSEKF